jgi:Tfp pilus tip-associated adhesin PilY1
MRNRTPSKLATLAATFGLVFCSFQASPEDIDIFSVDENLGINNPNVLFVVENNSNWTRQSQQWPDVTSGGQHEDQGQSEAFAIKTVVSELGPGINVGFFEYVTGGSAGDTDFGYARYNISPMTDVHKSELGTILDHVYTNINEPPEKRSSGNPFGELFHDIYNYLGGFQQANKGAGTPQDPAGVTADARAYQSKWDTFRSPLTTLDSCTRTIVIFISNNKSTDPTVDSTANVDALKALATEAAGGDADVGAAAISQIEFADYKVTTKAATSPLGYSPSCYASASACTTAANADPALCAEEGFTTCTCNTTGSFDCPAKKYTVIGTQNSSTTKVVDGPTATVTENYPLSAQSACQNTSQAPTSTTCPLSSQKVQADTPQAGQTTTTDTSYAKCRYVADATGCVGQKAKYTFVGTRTDTVTVTETVTTTTTKDLGETSSCFTEQSSCAPDASMNCGSFNGGCQCTTAGTTCASSGTKRFPVVGNYQITAATQTGTFSAAPPGPYMLDEWARFLRQTGVPIAGLTERAQVTTYTIDVFNENQNAVQSALLFNAARVGGGKYFQAKNRNALINALRQILTEVQAVNSAFSSASLPVNATNRAQNENQVFIGVFKPDRTKEPRWFGNLKRYQLVSTGATIDLGDANGKSAINNQTGFITECAESYWTTNSDTYWLNRASADPEAKGTCKTNTTSDYSDLPDGPLVEKGAVAEVIRRGNDAAATPDSDGNYKLNRTVYTASSGSLVEFLDGSSTGGVIDDKAAAFIRGSDILDEDTDNNVDEPRSDIHGDVVHSRPQPVNYGDVPAAGTGVVVYYGANDGTFRAVRAKTGQELWSFVAPEHFGKLQRVFDNFDLIRYFGSAYGQPKDYFFDGSTGVYQSLEADGKTVKDTWIFPTMRRGGRSIYGFDVSDPYKPKLLWRRGCMDPSLTDDSTCDSDLKGIGQSWPLPNVAFIKSYSTTRPVVVQGGGYDDRCDDQNTAFPACPSPPKGAGVYVFDAEDGTLVRHFDFTKLSGFSAGSIAADVSLIDTDNDKLVDYGYAVDTGGNVYRMDFQGDKATWGFTRVAYTNGFGRKFLFPPALVQVTATKVYLALGSGDREHPLRGQYPYDDRDGDTVSDGGVLNRFYVFKDELTDVSDTTVLNLDNDDPTSPPAMANYSKGSDCSTERILPSSALQGWFIDLNEQGQGEQTVTSAVIAAGFVFFSTNRPTLTTVAACTTSLGEARGYFLNLLNASGALQVSGACGGSRSSTFVGGGLPPSPVLATVPIGAGCATGGPDCELKTVVIGAVQKTGEPSSPIQSQRVRPPITSDRKPIYWYKSTGDK